MFLLALGKFPLRYITAFLAQCSHLVNFLEVVTPDLLVLLPFKPASSIFLCSSGLSPIFKMGCHHLAELPNRRNLQKKDFDQLTNRCLLNI